MSPVVHLTEDQIQGLADSTLRGPEGMAAREHADTCEECGAELAMYGALVQRLATLQDPMPPADFTSGVLEAVAHPAHHLPPPPPTRPAPPPPAPAGPPPHLGWGPS